MIRHSIHTYGSDIGALVKVSLMSEERVESEELDSLGVKVYVQRRGQALRMRAVHATYVGRDPQRSLRTGAATAAGLLGFSRSHVRRVGLLRQQDLYTTEDGLVRQFEQIFVVTKRNKEK